jgi:predicted LPLAT superfamily acyltransferase
MPEWQGKSRGNKLGYSIFVKVISTLGVLPAYFLLRFVALYYFLFSWTSSGHIFRYFRDHHAYSSLRAWLNVYRNYFVFGQSILDKIIVMAEIQNKFTYDFDGEDNLVRMVEQGKGGILISAHVGNWEVAGHLLKRLKTRINVVMFDGEHEHIKQYMNEVTGGRKFNVIIIRDDLSHVYAIGEALQKNELICLHADRFLEGNKTASFRFLGKDARFPLGPFQLAAAFQVPVSVVFAFKESSTHYHFFGSAALKRTPNESKADFIQRLMERFVDELEEKVKQYPEQWFNYYNFWS